MDQDLRFTSTHQQQQAAYRHKCEPRDVPVIERLNRLIELLEEQNRQQAVLIAELQKTPGLSSVSSETVLTP